MATRSPSPLFRLRDACNLLALGQNGQPLTRDHGAPCRARIPALYGMMNAKWLERITLVAGMPEGYWALRGWSRTGEVRTESRIDVAPAAPRAGQPEAIAGVAWAGERGISRVEVSTDGGRTWREARLNPPLSGVAWTQWVLHWTPDRPGTQVLTCRATDGNGEVQITRSARPHPAGATGLHRVSVRVS